MSTAPENAGLENTGSESAGSAGANTSVSVSRETACPLQRAGDKPLRQLAADHSGRAGDEDVHGNAMEGGAGGIRQK